MSFQALARTWRPRRFDQLVGQEHIVRALTHALDSDKLHHALLFSGTRGVGKTTLARIIAKCLNCEHGVSASPCVRPKACSSCREIDDGRYVDLIEVDAASRTGVDDTRELMDNVQYAPTRGRTKVYLIDEVHMLTKHSFNALLKTLEEPPPRVQFLLATTEPDKIPVTILSRCLQFPLKRLAAARIADRLRYIVESEALSADDGALVELARGADGSVRDSLSLLDQAVAFGGGHLDVESVRDMLGTIGDARIAELVDAIIDARAADALAALESLYAQGIDMQYLLDALATAWQHIATIQVVGRAVDEAGVRWQAAAERLDPRTTQLFYDITLAGVRDLRNAPDPLIGLRMCLLRMLAFKPSASLDQPAKAAPAAGGDGPGPAADSSPPDAQRSAREAMAKAREQLQNRHASRSTGQPTSQDAGDPAECGEGGPRPSPAPELAEKVASAPTDAVADPTDRAVVIESRPDGAIDSGPTQPPRDHAASLETAAPAVDKPVEASHPPSTGESRRALLAPAQATGDEQERAEDDITTEDALIDGAIAARCETNNSREALADHDGDRFDPAAVSIEEQPQNSKKTSHGFDFDTTDNHPEDWYELVPTLDAVGFAAQLARNGICRHLDNQRIELEIARANAFLATEDARERLQAALARTWDAATVPCLKIHVVDEVDDTPAKRVEADADKRQQDAVASIENDPIIEKLRSRLGARLRPETIKPRRAPRAMHNRGEQ